MEEFSNTVRARPASRQKFTKGLEENYYGTHGEGAPPLAHMATLLAALCRDCGRGWMNERMDNIAGRKSCCC